MALSQQLVDRLLRENHSTSLEGYLIESREAGRSLEQISKALADLTEGAIDVSYQTIRRWCHDYGISTERAAAEGAA